ncbi:hypothetical protein JHK87_050131 [Glycine soja]|nr:hypothetical protein JHK87_050131 [Glycine soja]
MAMPVTSGGGDPNPPHGDAALPVHPAPVNTNLNHTITEKLDLTNYLFWRTQVKPVIRGYNLLHFIHEVLIPQRFATVEDANAGRVTETFELWDQQDQLLLSWSHSTISAPILQKFVNCKTSWHLWDRINNHFHTHMNVKCNHLRTLHQLTLDGHTVSEFLSAIQDLVDSLNAIGEPISVHEHIAVIVEGLPETYESSISFIDNHAEPLTVDEIETLLIGH